MDLSTCLYLIAYGAQKFSGMVGIAIDAWTSSNGHAFVAIMMQYLDDDWNIRAFSILTVVYVCR